MKLPLDKIKEHIRRIAASVVTPVQRVLGNVHGPSRWIVLGSAGMTVMTLVSVLTIRWLLPHVGQDYKQVSIAEVMEQLDAGELELVRELIPRTKIDYEDDAQRATFLFLQGASAAYDAEYNTTWDDRFRTKFYAVATRYLEQSRELGFPKDREYQGLLLLGRSLHESGQFEQSIPILRDLLDIALSPEDQSPILEMLSNAYYRMKDPNLNEALRWKDQQIAIARGPESERHRLKLQKAELLFARGDIAASLEELESIPLDSDHHTSGSILRVRLLMHQASQLQESAGDPQLSLPARNKYMEAATALSKISERVTPSSDNGRIASLFHGIILKRLGKMEDAHAVLAKVRRGFHGTPEALFAAVEESSVLRAQDMYEEAAEISKQVLLSVTAPESFENRWLSLNDVKRHSILAFNDFLESKQFSYALELAAHFVPTFSEVEQVQYEGRAYRLWGEELFAKVADMPPTEAKQTKDQAFDRMGKSGDRYLTLARMRYDQREYPDDLWMASASYLKAHDFEKVVLILREYLGNEVNRRQPNAMIALSKAHLALDETSVALSVIEDCLAYYPNDPATYEARLLASAAYSEQGEVDRARRLLEDNLYRSELTPASSEWRDSLFELGRLEYKQGLFLEAKSRFDPEGGGDVDSEDPEVARIGLNVLAESHALHQKALAHLEELVQRLERYPNAKQEVMARYMIADAYHQSALYPRKQYPLATIASVKAHLRKQETDNLQKALDGYEQLRAVLSLRQDREGLTPMEATILRNCYFAQGKTLLKLGRYEDAIRVYSTATSHFQQYPECLEAFVQIADCYRHLDRPDEARGTIEQAKVVLGRLDDETDFLATTRFTKEQWNQALHWLGSF